MEMTQIQHHNIHLFGTYSLGFDIAVLYKKGKFLYSIVCQNRIVYNIDNFTINSIDINAISCKASIKNLSHHNFRNSLY